ncbi:MAG: DUF1499 domain-containing protein [Spirochaetaceae bacterium]
MKIQMILLLLILITGCASISPKLGIENGLFAECPDSPNCVSSMAKDEKFYIKPIIALGTSIEINRQIINILNQIKSADIIINEDYYIRAEYNSKIFGFVDDVEFYFPKTKTEEIIIHIRSASRLGYSDMGVNRKRVEDFRIKFKILNSK